MSWRLRKPDGSIYGPVAFPEFYRWAAEGRILPDDFVAEGDGDWVPAPSVAELELDWLLPRGETVLGPLHLLAYAELLQERMLSGSEPIVKKTGGEPIPVGQAVAAELLQRAAAGYARARDAGLREKLAASERAREEISGQIDALKAERAAASEELARLRARLDEETARADAACAELARALAQNEQWAARAREETERNASLQAALDREREAAAQRQAESVERLRAAERELETVKAQRAAASEELARLRARLDEETARADAARTELARVLAQNEQLAARAWDVADAPIPSGPEKLNATGREKEFQDLTRRYERMLARAREESERNAQLRAELDREREAAAQRQAESAERLRAAEQEIEALKARLKDHEAHFQEVTRDFRELNDRYIRLRSEMESGSAGGKPKVRLA
jgi:chromosome segregation ATPase